MNLGQHIHRFFMQQLNATEDNYRGPKTPPPMHPMHSHSNVQTFNLYKGLKEFGDEGYEALTKEIGQLHGRGSLHPSRLQDLTYEEAKKTLETVTVLLCKKTGQVKARTCANGSVQRNWMSKEDVTSPTALFV